MAWTSTEADLLARFEAAETSRQRMCLVAEPR